MLRESGHVRRFIAGSIWIFAAVTYAQAAVIAKDTSVSHDATTPPVYLYDDYGILHAAYEPAVDALSPATIGAEQLRTEPQGQGVTQGWLGRWLSMGGEGDFVVHVSD